MEYFIINAFTDESNLFGGNPAGVCFLEDKIPDELMQKIAYQNNLSETAFITKSGDDYDLKWFTPITEIKICGHATLASAYVLRNFKNDRRELLNFNTKSGVLTAKYIDEKFILNFPSTKPIKCEKPRILAEALGIEKCDTYLSRDLLVLLDSASEVERIRPDFNLLSSLKDVHGVIVTAKGIDCDFVSRFFAPNVGVNEDPVTGSSHCTLIPFWSEKLKQSKLVAKQLSKRGGVLFCEDCGDRVTFGGSAVCYLKGNINI